MMNEPIKGFFAYPSQPASIPETILAAIHTINESRVCQLTSWQACRVGGKIVIDVICRAIDEAQIFCADLTGSNPNVMFELGHAIARRKRIWLILDTSRSDSKKVFEQIRILTTVGYTSYCNSREITAGFFKDQPYTDLQNSIYAMSVEPSLSPREREALLYLKARHNTEAAVKLSACVNTFKIPTTIDDPSESAVQPLVWYAKKTLSAVGVLVHLCGPSREGAALHNSRYAFVAGLAHGFQRPLLMLAEADYVSPIDYRDLLALYDTPAQCDSAATSWLEHVSADYARRTQYDQDYRHATTLAADLKSLRIGEYIAENEENDLEEYFVETSAFLEGLTGKHTLVVGRKGSGKTANLYTIAKRLSTDKRNLVCVVKPASYEFHSIVRLLGSYQQWDEKGYLAESLWKFLLYTEIAKAVDSDLDSKRAAFIPGSPEDNLSQILSRDQAALCQDFAVRLERAVQSLSGVAGGGSVEGFRTAVSERLHGSVLRELRQVLGQVLTGRERVAVLVDNLDKAWDRRSDLGCLSDFLLGLLRAVGDIRRDFSRGDYWREPVSLTLTVFLRSDIFAHLMNTAREPDKISYCRLLWDDAEMLLRVIDQRLMAARGHEGDPLAVWREMFCSDVRGIPVRDYLVQRTLPRPRDIVFFVSAAIAAAVNRGHARVEERDVVAAEKQYSQFVFENIQVENGITVPELETVLYEFAGQSAVLPEDRVMALIEKAGIPHDRGPSVIRHLCGLSFLGVETAPGMFSFSAEEEEAQKHEVLARKLAQTRDGILNYKINAPFHAFLEIGV